MAVWIWGFIAEVVPLALLGLQCALAMADSWIHQHGNGTRVAGVFTGDARSPLHELVGRWYIQERHNMDEFLRGLGFGSIQRSLIAKAGQETEILQSETGDAVTIVTSDLRGSTSLELPVNGPSIAADDGDGGARVLRAAKVERGAVVVTETLQGEREPLSVCKRKLGPDGRMVVDVRKRTPEGKSFVEMQVIAARRNDA